MPEIQVFRPPRPKKSVLPPPSKKRKTNSTIEEINFDFSAREDYLTGFHKRKLQRVKMAQEEAAKKEREERIRMRKQLREEKKQELEEHVRAVNAALKSSQAAIDGSEEDGESEDSEGWNGIEDDDDTVEPVTELLDHQEEYIDEDKYTTVTVEEVGIDKEGIHKIADERDYDDDDEGDRYGIKHNKTKEETSKSTAKNSSAKKEWPKKQKKKKFRYETKVERRFALAKQKASKRAKAQARKGE